MYEGFDVAATIALVDDDRNILTSVSMALEAEGFTVQSYVDGAEALKGLSQAPADLVVLDIKMPRLDGMELLSRLRRTSDVPAIFLTSKDDDVDEALGLKMGADDYVRKPFEEREVFGKMAEHLGVTVPAIQSRLHRARARMRSLLTAEGVCEEDIE